MKNQSKRRLILVGLALHLGLLSWAALLYPGGTHWDATVRGFRPGKNFWCDLMRPVSHGGADNTNSALLARLSLLVLALLVPFFFRHLARGRSASPWTRRGLTTCADLGSLGLLLVALGRNSSAAVHDLAILTLGPFGLLAILGGVLISLGDRRWAAQAAGLLTILFSIANMLQYARESLLEAPSSTWLPLVQLLATGSLLLWMILVMLPQR